MAAHHLFRAQVDSNATFWFPLGGRVESIEPMDASTPYVSHVSLMDLVVLISSPAPKPSFIRRSLVVEHFGLSTDLDVGGELDGNIEAIGSFPTSAELLFFRPCCIGVGLCPLPAGHADGAQLAADLQLGDLIELSELPVRGVVSGRAGSYFRVLVLPGMPWSDEMMVCDTTFQQQGLLVSRESQVVLLEVKRKGRGGGSQRPQPSAHAPTAMAAQATGSRNGDGHNFNRS